MRAPFGVLIMDDVSPEDLTVVEQSWVDLRNRRDAVLARLAALFTVVGRPDTATARARWLYDAVGELVGLLRAPSSLGERARQLACSWPDPGTTPSFRIEGRAWMMAANEVSPTWTVRSDRAWSHA